MSSSDDGDGDGDGGGPNLPHDVAVEILKRLPVRCLLRFRCVCRSWRSTIDDPRFAALHFSHSALDASNWHTARLDWWDPVHNVCSLFSNESLTLPFQSQIEIPFVTLPDCFIVVGSCDGLICVLETSVNDYGQVMYLWNLFTRKHKAVRRSGLEHRFVSMETAHMVLGFGFDARSNDYKIVRILYLDDNRRGRKAQVEIYMLRTDRWRSSECEIPSLCNDSAVFLNGNLHWFEGGHGSIVLFDVAGEVFDKMAPPEEISHLDADADVLVMSLAVLNDLLAVYISFIDPVMDPEQHSICSVWVMGEYGVPESWNKLYTFNPCGEVVGFDGFMRNGELLMEIYGGGRVSWNPITGQYANFPHVTRCNLVTVVESIVSL